MEFLSLGTHVLIAGTIGIVGITCTNVETLFILLLCVAGVYWQIVMFDGCILTKLDLKIDGWTPTQLIKAALGLPANTTITDQQFEVMLLAATVIMLITKIAWILAVEWAFHCRFVDAVAAVVKLCGDDTLEGTIACAFK